MVVVSKLRSAGNKGSALTISLVTVAVISAAFIGVYSIFLQAEKSALRILTKSSAMMIKESMMSLIANDAAWSETIARNANLACLRAAGAVCDPASVGTFSLFDGAGNVVFDSTNAAAGFDLTGASCSSFPSQACPFRFEFRIDCGVLGCAPTLLSAGQIVPPQPNVDVVGRMQVEPSRNWMNLALTGPYAFQFSRTSPTRSLSSVCAKMGGTYNSVTEDCTSPVSAPPSFTCPRGTMFQGFQVNGLPNCSVDRRFNTSCPVGTAVLGYVSDGSIICGSF